VDTRARDSVNCFSFDILNNTNLIVLHLLASVV